MGSKNISEGEVRQTLAEVMHPAIDRSLVELGMIKNITITNNKVALTLLLPFPDVPIKDYLVNSVHEAMVKLNVEVEIKIGQMTQKELQSFLAMEQESWGGST
jgi:metal-sulfur cluster biosynthetic enzyme